MSDIALFAVGCFVFALTVVGAVMAGGFWFGRIQEEAEDDDRAWRPPAPDTADAVARQRRGSSSGAAATSRRSWGRR